ncbi:MAG: ketopantoate reductase family protein [Deltaproteobacteria bacterium]|nr:ketopantoate reductase family protein [Deltaproteobacteria bacterium]
MSLETSPKIVIMGAGAVGSLFGGLLAQAGKDVTLIGSAEHVKAIQQDGLHLDGVLGEMTIRLPAAEQLTFKPDIVLLAVKSPDVVAACRHMAPYLADVPILTLQNGVTSDRMAGNIVGEHQVIGGIVLFNARFFKPGHVTYLKRGAFVIGEAFQENGARARDIRDMLNQATPTTLCSNMQGACWTKLLLNLYSNSLEAMTGERLQVCLNHPGMGRVGILILKEALRVMEHAKIKLASLPGIPISMLKLIIKSPRPVASRIFRVITNEADTFTSTLQSLLRGRPSEIGFLNGEIVKLGQRIHVATPYNSKVVDLIREIESTHQFFPPSHVEQLFY